MSKQVKRLIAVIPHVHVKETVDKTAYRKLNPRNGKTTEQCAQQDRLAGIVPIDAMEEHTANAARDHHREMGTATIDQLDDGIEKGSEGVHGKIFAKAWKGKGRGVHPHR